MSGSNNEGRRKLLDLSGKKTKKLPAWQVYSKLYYKMNIKQVMQAQWKVKYLAENPDHDHASPIPPAPLQFQNAVTRELYEQESPEVKEVVRNNLEKRGVEDVGLGEGENEDLGPEEHERRKVAVDFQT